MFFTSDKVETCLVLGKMKKNIVQKKEWKA